MWLNLASSLFLAVRSTNMKRDMNGREQRKGMEGKRTSTFSGTLLFELEGGGRRDAATTMGRGGDDGCGSSGEYGDTSERAVGMATAAVQRCGGRDDGSCGVRWVRCVWLVRCVGWVCGGWVGWVCGGLGLGLGLVWRCGGSVHLVCLFWSDGQYASRLVGCGGLDSLNGLCVQELFNFFTFCCTV